MIENIKYPDPFASNSEKDSIEYGKQVGEMIDAYWFQSGRINARRRWIDKMRAYSRGEQDTYKYKRILEGEATSKDAESIKTYKIDYEPLKILPMFKDIITNSIDESLFKPRAEAIDPISVNRKKKYYSKIDESYKTKELQVALSQALGVNVTDKNIPKDERALKIKKMEFKPLIEMAQELFIQNVLKDEQFEIIKDKVDEDLFDLGVGVVKHYTDYSQGIKLEYIDPYNWISNDFEMDDGRDIRYHGVLKRTTISQLNKRAGGLTEEQLLILKNKAIGNPSNIDPYKEEMDGHRIIEYLEIAYKLQKTQVFKKRYRNNKPVKLIEKTDKYNPMLADRKISIPYEIWYEGIYVPQAKIMLSWQPIQNQAEAGVNKPFSPFLVYAPKVKKLSEKGYVRFDSMVNRAVPLIDDLHLDYFKFQQLKHELRPTTVKISPRVLEQTMLGGKPVDPKLLLNLYFGRGLLLADDFDEEGDRVGEAIREIPGGINNTALGFLSSEFANHYQRIRQLLGINELRDGTTRPNTKTSVTVQKILLASSNNATNHIVKASFNLSLQICQAISSRLYDVMTTKALRERYVDIIGTDNTELLDELKKYPMSKFAIYFDFRPDNEERVAFEQSLIADLQAGKINSVQYNKARMIKNTKEALKYLEFVIDENEEKLQKLKEKNIQLQANANAKASVVAEQTRQQTLTIEYETYKQKQLINEQLKEEYLLKEAQVKELQAQKQHDREMEKLRLELGIKAKIEENKEDRKDKRIDQKDTNQSVLIEQRKKDLPPKNFFNKLTDIFSDNKLLQSDAKQEQIN